MNAVVKLLLGSIVAAAAVVPVAHADDGYTDFLDGSTNALILGPTGTATPDAAYISTAESLYLNPNGFDGDAVALTTPETSDFGPSVTAGEADLVSAIEVDYSAGDMSAADPLTVVTYSQSSVIASLAEQQLHNYGIPTEDLRFLMVGDTSSAEGGFLNSYLSEAPSWLSQDITNLLNQEGWGNILGATTPNDLYPTDVYTIQGDGWADFTSNIWNDLFGMSVTHQEYFGLTADQIASATVSVDGLTDYYTIANPGLEALWTALENVFGGM